MSATLVPRDSDDCFLATSESLILIHHLQKLRQKLCASYIRKTSPSDCASRVRRPGVAKTRLEKMIETFKIPIAFRAGLGNLNRMHT